MQSNQVGSCPQLLCLLDKLLGWKRPVEVSGANFLGADFAVVHESLVHVLDALLHDALFRAQLLDLLEVVDVFGVVINLQDAPALLFQRDAFLGHSWRAASLSHGQTEERER